MPEPAAPNPAQDPSALSPEGVRLLGAFFDRSLPDHARTRIGERLVATQPAATLITAICENVLVNARDISSKTTWMDFRADYTAAQLVAKIYQSQPELQPRIEGLVLEAMRERGPAQFAFAIVEAEGERLLTKLVPACIEKILDEEDLETRANIRWALTVIVDRLSTQDVIGASALAGNLMAKATRDARRAAIVTSMLTEDLGRLYHMSTLFSDEKEAPKGVGKTFLAPWGKELDELVGTAMGLAHAATHALSNVEYGREIVAALESKDSGKQVAGLFCILTGAAIINRDFRERAKVAIGAMTLENELFVYKNWIAPALGILNGWDDFFSQFRAGREPEE